VGRRKTGTGGLVSKRTITQYYQEGADCQVAKAKIDERRGPRDWLSVVPLATPLGEASCNT